MQLSWAQNKSEVFFEKGESFFEKDSLDLAVNYYTKAIELNNEYTYALISRGIVYERLKQFEQAEADYKKALSQNPRLLYKIAILGF